MCAPLWGKQDKSKYYGAYCTDILPASKTGHFLKSYFDDKETKEIKEETGVTYDYLIMNDFTVPLSEDGENDLKSKLVKLLDESVFKNKNHNNDPDHDHELKNITVDNVKFYSEDMSDI